MFVCFFVCLQAWAKMLDVEGGFNPQVKVGCFVGLFVCVFVCLLVCYFVSLLFILFVGLFAWYCFGQNASCHGRTKVKLGCHHS